MARIERFFLIGIAFQVLLTGACDTSADHSASSKLPGQSPSPEQFDNVDVSNLCERPLVFPYTAPFEEGDEGVTGTILAGHQSGHSVVRCYSRAYSNHLDNKAVWVVFVNNDSNQVERTDLYHYRYEDHVDPDTEEWELDQAEGHLAFVDKGSLSPDGRFLAVAVQKVKPRTCRQVSDIDDSYVCDYLYYTNLVDLNNLKTTRYEAGIFFDRWLSESSFRFEGDRQGEHVKGQVNALNGSIVFE